MFVIELCQKIEYNALFMMIFIPVSNFGDQPLNGFYELVIKNKCTFYLLKLVSVYFFDLDLWYCNQVNSSRLMQYI